MHLLILALVICLLMHDARAPAMMPAAQFGWSQLALVLVPKAVLVIAYAAACVAAHRQLATNTIAQTLRRLDRVTVLYYVLVLATYSIDLALGVLTRIRSAIGDLIIVDEAVMLTAPILMVVWAWWSYYPIDRRLREAVLMRRLDAGLPVTPVWTRTQCIVSQLRHQVGLVLLPLLCLLGWSEAVARFAPEYWPVVRSDPRPALLLAGSLSIFMLAPLMIRHLWDTAPLPPGPLRQRLEEMCQQHGVRVRDLLLWRTFGGMINGAVMGLIAPLRFILLTDALLESLPQPHVEAVMAHELAHVRRHHMFWLVAVAAGAMGVLSVAWALALPVMFQLAGLAPNSIASTVGLDPVTSALSPASSGLPWLATIAATITWAGVLGWTSRRFERQADTFAVQHLARNEISGPDQHERPSINPRESDTPCRADRESLSAPLAAPLIGPAPIATMASALQQIADLNSISTARRSWRHGSIAWRQAYLRSLQGTPIDRAPIDKIVFRIKAAAASSLFALFLLYCLDPQWLIHPMP